MAGSSQIKISPGEIDHAISVLQQRQEGLLGLLKYLKDTTQATSGYWTAQEQREYVTRLEGDIDLQEKGVRQNFTLMIQALQAVKKARLDAQSSVRGIVSKL